MKRRMIIVILTIQDFFQQQFDVMLKLFSNLSIICHTKQVLELGEDAFVLSGVKFGVFLAFKLLNLEEEMNEVVSARRSINIDREYRLQSLVAFGILAHCSIMNWISPERILLGQDLPIPVNNVLGILLEKIENSNIEVLVPLHRLRIMEDRARQVTMLDVHVLESISVLLSQKLIEQGLLQVHSLDVEESYHAVEITSITYHMITISALVINIDLLMNHILRCAHFSH